MKLKETIELFAYPDDLTGDGVISIVHVPGIVVSALQDLADFGRQEANLSVEPKRYRGVMDMVHAIEAYQDKIKLELM